MRKQNDSENTPSLKNVVMWSGNAWKPVTAEEASAIYPVTVSAKKRQFMCDLCCQNVILTRDGYIKPYFKHSSSEESKDCPDRTFGQGSQGEVSSYNNRYRLPIRIKIIHNTFELELGFIRIPEEMRGSGFCIEIKPEGNNKLYEYSKERLEDKNITYLSIGKVPSSEYHLSFKPDISGLRKYWPEKIKGINPKGTLFEKASGKMLQDASEVTIEKEYYLLIQKPLDNIKLEGITVEKIAQLLVNKYSWFVYCVSASRVNECAAVFFRDYRCKLTEKPVFVQPVWPLFAERDSIIRHNWDKNNTVFLTNDVISHSRAYSYNKSSLKIYNIYHKDNPDLIFYRRNQQYVWFWKEPIGIESSAPKISVKDISGKSVEPGNAGRLPKYRSLVFESPYDGELVVSRNGYISSRREISADNVLLLNEITWGVSIRFFVGLDCLWEIVYQKQYIKKQMEGEDTILKYISPGNRSIISAPHSLYNIALRLKSYPKVFIWIKKCIETGKIDAQAYRRLQEVYRRIISKRIPGGEQ